MKETDLPTHGMLFAISGNIFKREMLKNGYAPICGYAPTSPTSIRAVNLCFRSGD